MIEVTGPAEAVNAHLVDAVEQAKSADPDTTVLRATLPDGDVMMLRTHRTEDSALFGTVLDDSLMCRVHHLSKLKDGDARWTEGLVTYAFLLDAGANPTGIMHTVAQGHYATRGSVDTCKG